MISLFGSYSYSSIGEAVGFVRVLTSYCMVLYLIVNLYSIKCEVVHALNLVSDSYLACLLSLLA